MSFPRWKLREILRTIYEEGIVSIEADLKIQRQMAEGFLDSKDFEALSSMHLVICQDEQRLDELQVKLDLLNDDSTFEQVCNEQEQESNEDDR